MKNELLNFTGKTIVVTGGAGHIAQQYCQMVAGFGARCILLDLCQQRLDDVVAVLPKVQSGAHKGYTIDISSIEEIVVMVGWLDKEFGIIDCLVNNASFTGDSAMEGWVTEFQEQSLGSWNSALSVNLTASFLMAQKMSAILGLSLIHI